MAKQPYIPLYIGDWEKDTNCLTNLAEYALFKLTFKLFNAEKRGVFCTNFRTLSVLFKADLDTTKEIFNEIIFNKVLDIEAGEDGIFIIKSRRMLRESNISELRSEIGKKGAIKKQAKRKQTLKNSEAKHQQNTDNDIEDDNINSVDANQKIKGADFEKNKAIDDFLEHVKPSKSSAKKEKELPSHFQVIEHIEKTAHWRNTCEHYGIKSDQRESLFKIFYEQKEDNYKIRLPTWTDIAQNFYFWVKIHLSKNEIDKVKNQISKPNRGPAASIETFTAILKPVP